jgi:hypothetical protein
MLGRIDTGIVTQKIEPHWSYLLAIEHELNEVSRFVEFDERNFDCFSIEIARLLLTSAAEVDVVCKRLCKIINQESKANSIHQYETEIVAAFPSIPQFQVLLPRFGLTLTPWNEWSRPGSVPFWWTAYNKIKHHRDSEYHRASLKNALNAVAGLFVVVLHLYKDKANRGQLGPLPELLRVEDIHYKGWSLESSYAL